MSESKKHLLGMDLAELQLVAREVGLPSLLHGR